MVLARWLHAEGGGNGARGRVGGILEEVCQMLCVCSALFGVGPLDILMGRWTLYFSPTLHRHGSDGPLASRPTTSILGGVNSLRATSSPNVSTFQQG